MPAGHEERDLGPLLAACRAGDGAAWCEFVSLTQPVIARACLAAARSWGRAGAASVEDFVQECYLKLAERSWLEAFELRHPGGLFAFLKLMASRVVHDRCRLTQAAKRGGASPHLSLVEESTGGAPGGADTELLFQQVESLIAEVSSGQEVDRDLLIFQLYYRLGLTAAAIAAIPSLELSVKGVESSLNRLTRLLRTRLAAGTAEARAAHGD